MLTTCALLVAVSIGSPPPDNLEEIIFGEGPERNATQVEGIVQNRKYELNHELKTLVGVLPVNPFQKALAATLGYTVHISDSWAWEAVELNYLVNFDTKLKREVLRNRDVQFPELLGFACSHLVFKPLYGKEAFFNTDVVHMEGFLQAGPAIVARSDHPTTALFGADVGLGLRLWLSRVVSLRLDLGELLYFPGAFAQAFHMHLGTAFTFGGDT